MTQEEQGYYPNGEWKGCTRFQCMFCAFDSLHEVTIRDHVIMRHQLQVVSKQMVPLSVTLYGPDNKQIESREATDAENSNKFSDSAR